MELNAEEDVSGLLGVLIKIIDNDRIELTQASLHQENSISNGD